MHRPKAHGHRNEQDPGSRPRPKRFGWTSGLDEDELTRPGGVLLAMLIHRANERGQHLNDMAQELGVNHGYIIGLRRGERRVDQISDQFAWACALYLGCPRATVLLAAGRIKPEDVFEDPFEVILALPAALRLIQSHPWLGPLMPPEVFVARPELQLFIVTLFEAAENRKLLPGRQSIEEMAKMLHNYALRREELLKQVEGDRQAKFAEKG